MSNNSLQRIVSVARFQPLITNVSPNVTKIKPFTTLGELRDGGIDSGGRADFGLLRRSKGIRDSNLFTLASVLSYREKALV